MGRRGGETAASVCPEIVLWVLPPPHEIPGGCWETGVTSPAEKNDSRGLFEFLPAKQLYIL